MVTETKAPEVESQPSEATANPVSDAIEAERSIADATGGDTGEQQAGAQEKLEETTLAKAKPAAVTEATPTPLTGEELQAKHDRGEPLTSEEKPRLYSYQQSEADKAAKRQAQRQEERQTQEALKVLWTEQAPAALLAAYDAEYQDAENEGRAVSRSMLHRRHMDVANALQARAEGHFEQRKKAEMADAVMELTGVSPAIREQLEGLTSLELHRAGVRLAYNLGKKETVGDVVSKADHDQALKDAAAAERDRLISENPERFSSTNGAKEGGGGYSTKMQARALHVAGRISNTEMRGIDNDPAIPEG